VQLVCLDPFLMIVYKLTKPLKQNLLFHLVVITELCIVPIQHLKFAVWSVWAKHLKEVVIGARALEFSQPQLKLGFVLYLLDELEEGLERAEFLESCQKLLHIPLTVNKTSALVAINDLLVLVCLILCAEDAPRVLLEFGISLSQIIVALHHH
jgi:hypothetical protein